ncbi:tail fiber domain-containing protein [Parerythrobacter lacustris]|uniref:Tail fiber domain-containing protein n=1 Tax=Parerythrobacter lacustris TaxID=2969984 RepID=A0ABT1XP73_9SPHN|nr:tail fiber domain-containing protein [Parerythrobacter lacustris]MCR2833470.1 tail fiber domain-containing protein [Parerythrobacter lacustris]
MKLRRLVTVAATAALVLSVALAATPAHSQVISPARGGTGTSTIPSLGQLLVGQGNGTYAPQATSTLGIQSGGGTWGSITGILGDQTDLQDELDGKYDAGNPLGFISGIAWGDIGGLITDQTDLRSVLDGKLPGILDPPTANIFVGSGSGGSFGATDENNVGIGTNSLDALNNSNADGNFGLGLNALTALTSGDNNLAFGTNAGAALTTGGSNVLLGNEAGLSLTTTQSNVFIGDAAGRLNTKSGSVIIGRQANYLGDLNGGVAIGFQAGSNNTSVRNVFLGGSSGIGNTGFDNVYVGDLSGGTSAGNARLNVVVGSGSGGALTTGFDNLFAGYRAGNITTTGSNLIMLGQDTNASSATASNELNIGNTLYGSLSTGRIGIGTSSPQYRLSVVSDSDTNIFQLYDSDGNCLQNPESGAITTSCSSDQKLKANIRDSSRSATGYLNGFRIRDYEVRTNGETRTGVIAQEVALTHPELVQTISLPVYGTTTREKLVSSVDEKGRATLAPVSEPVQIGTSTTQFVTLPSTWELVKAIQELDARVTALEAQKVAAEDRADTSENRAAGAGALLLAGLAAHFVNRKSNAAA